MLIDKIKLVLYSCINLDNIKTLFIIMFITYVFTSEISKSILAGSIYTITLIIIGSLVIYNERIKNKRI